MVSIAFVCFHYVRGRLHFVAFSDCMARCNDADGNVLQFENGYLVETVVEGNEIGVVPYKIRVSDDGELFAVDEVNSNIVKITPPLSQCMSLHSYPRLSLYL